MSHAGDRLLIAAAANTVQGISAEPYFHASLKAGDAIVRRDTTTYPQNGFGGLQTWQLVLFLPTDTAQSERYLDDKADQLVAALSDQLTITRVQPSRLALETGVELPVCIFEGLRETE